MIRRPATYADVITLIKQRLIRYPSDTCRGATIVQQMSSYFDKCLLIKIQIFLARQVSNHPGACQVLSQDVMAPYLQNPLKENYK